MNKPYILSVKMKCPDGFIMETKHRHDYQTHVCEVTGDIYMLDGGHGYYYRTSHNEVPAEVTVIDTNSPFEEQRQVNFWKSYGKSGEYFPEGIYLSLSEMSDDHIDQILHTQSHIRGTDVEVLFLNELGYRKTLNETK